MATTTQTSAAPPHFPEQVTGMYVLARSLKNIGIENVYGLVGIPITEAAYIIQEQGIRFIGFRHEQQAGMAAATEGYLTKKPGVLMTVSSLGFMNGLTATANATVNCYPMIQISGASDPSMVDMKMGTYEELDQLNTARPLVKATFRCNKAEDIPSAVNRAYRSAVSGRPGGVYIDITTPALGQILNRADAEKLLYQPMDLYSPVAPNRQSVERAVRILADAKRPVILLGKGAAYAQVDDSIRTLIENYGLPYFPMSMAKGVMPDKGPLSALSCRSTIMQKADVVMIVGARLNWLLSFGKGKWSPDTKFIQLDVEPQEIDVNRPIAAPVIGDIELSLNAILAELEGKKLRPDPEWLSSLHEETQSKREKFAQQLTDNKDAQPMNHWSALSAIKPIVESRPDLIIVNEGANTLDDTRVAIDMSLPRHRIDCATWAIMGMGMGSSIGAAVATGKSVLAIEGDSAFGFSGMDFSTICRYNLPVTVCIFNNGGIYNGAGVNLSNNDDPAPTTLDVKARYDKLGDAFGANTFYVTTPRELTEALTESLDSKRPALINVQLSADSGKESGHIGYLNPSPLQNIVV